MDPVPAIFRFTKGITMGLQTAATAALLMAVLSVNVIANDEWTEVKRPELGFVTMFPQAPKVSEQTMKEGSGAYTQHMFSLDQGGRGYLIAVFEYQPGVVPSKPDDTYFSKLLNAYLDGSHSRLREKHPKTIAGHLGVEAIADDVQETASHLLDLIAVGARLYLLVFIAPKGHQTYTSALPFPTPSPLLATN